MREPHAIAVDVADLQMAGLQKPQAGGVGRHQKRAVLQIRRLLEERCNLLTRQNVRQALRHLGARQIEFGLSALECHAVQKLQRAAHDIAAAVRELALFEQVQQVALDFLLCDLIRRAAVELREHRHRFDVRLLRAIG